MKILRSIILAFIVSISLHAKETPKNLLKELPFSIDQLSSWGLKVYDKPALGASMAYSRNTISGYTEVTIYIYDLGIKKIDSSVANQAYQMAVNDINGMHTDIVLQDKGKRRVKLPNDDFEIQYSIYDLRLSGTRNVQSFLFISWDKEFIYKIRISTKENNIEKELIDFADKIFSLMIIANKDDKNRK